MQALLVGDSHIVTIQIDLRISLLSVITSRLAWRDRGGIVRGKLNGFVRCDLLIGPPVSPNINRYAFFVSRF